MSEDIEFDKIPEGYAQFQIPGHQYSVIRMPLERVWISTAVAVARELADALDAAFAPLEQGGGMQAEQRSAPAQRPSGPSSDGAIAFCPDHDNAPMKLSAPQYNKDGDKFYHPLDRPIRRDGKEVKSHTLYWRQTVDAHGESNEGKFLPGATRRPVNAGRSDEPYYSDDEWQGR